MSRETRFFLLILGALAIVPVVSFPLTGTNAGYALWAKAMSVGSFCLIYLIASQALNVQVGMIGLLQLGAVAFVGVGAYTGALLLTASNAAGDPAIISFWQSILPALEGDVRVWLFFLDPNFLSYLTVIPAVLVAACVLCLLIGLPTLRLTGDYFAIVTLGFAQIFYLAVKNEDWLTYGAAGVKDIPAIFSFCTGEGRLDFWDKTGHYFFGLAVLAVTLIVIVRVRDSRLGRAFAAVRDDELCAQSHGVDVFWTKVASFVLFACLASLAGLVMIARNKLVSPNDLLFWESILYLCCIVLGGLGSVRGALVGAILLGSLGELMRLGMPKASELVGFAIPSQVRYVAFGVILIVVMRFKPDGLFPMAQEEAARGEAARKQCLDAPSDWFTVGGKEVG